VILLSQRTRTAHVEHECIWCPDKITIGERYLSQAVKDDEEFWFNKFHPECFEAFLSCWKETDGEIWPHESKRGSTEHA
jgi:hypothetical protein